MHASKDTDDEDEQSVFGACDSPAPKAIEARSEAIIIDESQTQPGFMERKPSPDVEPNVRMEAPLEPSMETPKQTPHVLLIS